MKTIMMTYPDFKGLPRGIKRMLVASEAFFFAEAGMRGPRPLYEISGNRLLSKPGHSFDSASRFSEWANAWLN